jgi:hypothetical protein
MSSTTALKPFTRDWNGVPCRFGGKVTFETLCELLESSSEASLLLWKFLDRPRTHFLNTKRQQDAINFISGRAKKQTRWTKENRANTVMGFRKNNNGLRLRIKTVTNRETMILNVCACFSI